MNNDDTVREIRRLERVLRSARTSIDPLVSTQLLQAFLAVASNEGKTLSDYADALGTNLSTASRQLLDLGDRNRKREPGYMLVDRQSDPMNLRINRYVLTPKGKLLMKELAQIMKD